jgi:hypothetical protein
MSAVSTVTNGSATVIGRGINHRKLDQHQRADLAADVVTGARPFLPSYGQVCLLFNVPTPVLRQHVKARREFAARHPEVAAGNGNGGDGNGNDVAALLAAMTDTERGEVVRMVGELLLRMSPLNLIETARRVGVDWIWDRMIAPVIQAEREDKAAVTP